MTLLRSLRDSLHRFSRGADRMQGQDVERPDLVQGRRVGGNFAALTKAHSNQGVTTLGMNR